MAFPTPSQLFSTFQGYLRSLKPGFNPNDTLSDFNIRGLAVTGMMSGIYADQEAVDNDTFIIGARDAAIIARAADYGISQTAATAAESLVPFTGSPGSVILAGQQLTYGPTGLTYQVATGGTIGGTGIIDLEVVCSTTGQSGNILAPDTLTLVSPPAGVNGTVTLSENMADGTDQMTVAQLQTLLLNRLQQPPAGGNANDYYVWAFATPGVVGAFIVRWGRGLGTVDIYITSGTTDIDAAVTAGTPVVRVPSGALIAAVQAYYNAAVPLTDCPEVWAPTTLAIPVTVYVDLIAGITLTSIPASSTYNPLNLTVLELIQREVGRVLYKYNPGGRTIPGQPSTGYVCASDIFEGLEYWLSAFADPAGNVGLIPILADWRVGALDPPNFNLPVGGNILPIPGTITVNLGT